MAALSVRVATSTLCNLNGSQRRQAMLSPVWYMGARPKPSNATATSSSHSHFFQSSRTNISSSKVYHLHHKTPRNLSVFAMSADVPWFAKSSHRGLPPSSPSLPCSPFSPLLSSHSQNHRRTIVLHLRNLAEENIAVATIACLTQPEENRQRQKRWRVAVFVE
ncbi:hypothetical protein AHAS_Ahas19G0274900 [Arachis hypogaea]